MQAFQAKINMDVQTLLLKKMEESLSYSKFMALMEKLVAAEETSGNEQKESLVNYTQLTQLNSKKTFRGGSIGIKGEALLKIYWVYLL